VQSIIDRRPDDDCEPWEMESEVILGSEQQFWDGAFILSHLSLFSFFGLGIGGLLWVMLISYCWR